MTTTTDDIVDVNVLLELHDDNAVTITLDHVSLTELDGVLEYLGTEQARDGILGQLAAEVASRLANLTGIPVPFLLTAAGMALLGQ